MEFGDVVAGFEFGFVISFAVTALVCFFFDNHDSVFRTNFFIAFWNRYSLCYLFFARDSVIAGERVVCFVFRAVRLCGCT